MIETMKRITITGPLEDFDRVVLRYLHSHKIEYISAQTQLSNMEHANLIQEKNPYELPLYTARDLLSYLNTEQEEIHLCDIDEALHLVHNLSERVHHYTALIEKYTDSLNSLPEESALEDCFKREHLNQLITEQERNLLSLLYAKRLEILSAYRTLELYQSCFQLRQYAVCITHTGFAPLYQLQGYIPESSIGHLFHDLHVDRRVEVYLDDCKIPDPIIPSKLKNNYFIKGYKHLIIKHHLPPYPLPDLSFLILLCYLLTFGSFYGNIRIGILLMIAGAAFSLGRSKNYGHIVFLCGGTCLIFGIIFYQLSLRAARIPFILYLLGSLTGIFIGYLYTLKRQPIKRIPLTKRPFGHFCCASLLLLLFGSLFITYDSVFARLDWLFILLLVITAVIWTFIPIHAGVFTASLYGFLQSSMFITIHRIQVTPHAWNLGKVLSCLSALALLCLLIYVQLYCLGYDVLFYRFTKESGHLFRPYCFHHRLTKKKN